jgi:SAM-dependent methyltransferase
MSPGSHARRGYARAVSADGTWSLGHYERTALELLPAARAAVEAAAPQPGENVLDLGCGTGNAAFLAAERGARVIGVDPARRLLEVAAEHARERGLDVEWRQGDASAIPLDSGTADVVISVFGVIFAPDPAAATAEMARVCAPGGRLVFTAWVPEGAIAQVGRVRAEAVGGGVDTPPPFPWHEREAVVSLLGAHGFQDLRFETRPLPFEAPSAETFLDAELRDHPVWIAAAPKLEASGRMETVRRRALEILEAANEDPPKFRVTSRYTVAVARRDL